MDANTRLSSQQSTSGSSDHFQVVARSLGLIVGVSISWVSVAQLARLAEQRTEDAQGKSVVPLMTCMNCNAWMLLAIPHMVRRAREPRSGSDHKDGRLFFALFQTEAFHVDQLLRFLCIAFATNLSYMAGLHYLPASLNTAIFCTNPVFTLFLSLSWLPSGSMVAEKDACGAVGFLAAARAAVFSEKGLSVLLSVIGVTCIAKPWHADTQDELGVNCYRTRLTGAFFSLLAALGTATYQVYFKSVFDDRLRPDEVGLFLAGMGALAAVLLTGVLAISLATGFYSLQLSLVPWHLVAATAAASTVFNFLIKFGITVDSPLAMSLATQIGIPMNLLLDVVVLHAHIDWQQGLGAAIMLLMFSIQPRRKLQSFETVAHDGLLEPLTARRMARSSGGSIH